jgi:hypothetical protein
MAISSLARIACSVLGNTLRASLKGACGLKAHLVALWRGDVPLGQAFWEYAIAYGTIANIVATAAAIVTVAAGLPETLAICLFLMPLPYILIAVVGVVRSADKYRGAPARAIMAKIAVILWGAAMVFL